MDNLLSSVNAAKAMGLVLLAHGIFHALAPNPTAKKYGVPSNEHGQYSPFVRRTGCSLLFTCAIVWCLIFQQDGDRHLAYALATSVYLVENLGEALNQEHSTLGGSDIPVYLMLAMNASFVYGFLNETWAPVTAKLGICVLLFFGLTAFLVPKLLHVKIWMGSPLYFEDEKHGPYMRLVMRALGVAMLQSGIFTALLEYGMDPVFAFGNSCVVLVFGLLSNINLSSFGFSVRHFAMASVATTLVVLMIRGGADDDDDEAAATAAAAAAANEAE